MSPELEGTPSRTDRERLAGHYSSRSRLPVRGRGDVLERVRASLTQTEEGAGNLLMLSGVAGIGKTRLLASAADLAEARGWRRLVVAPDIDSATVPLGALTDAALRSQPPLITPAELAPVLAGGDARFWVTRLLADGIEKAASDSAMIVIVDDVQWLDAGSLSALTSLVRDTRGLPVNWVMATRSGHYSAAHARFLSSAADQGALLPLSPLDDDAIDEIAADVFGARVGPRLHAALRATDGIPLLAVEMIRGLSEDQLVDTSRGVADVEEGARPTRYGAATREGLLQRSPEALKLAQVGALFGREFSLPSALGVLGWSAAEALDPTDELLGHEILIDTGPALAFRHDTILEAALATMTPSVRRALGRAVARRRLDDGESASAVAGTLAVVAEPGDAESVGLLFDAAEQLTASDVQGASTLAARAIALADGSPRFASRIAALIPVVWSGGRPDEAVAASAVIAPVLNPDEHARVLLSIARLLTESSFDEAIRTCDRALQIEGIADATRVELLAVRLLNCANSADPDGIRSTLVQARAAADPARDGIALATIDACESVLRFNEADFARAVELQRAAERRLVERGMPVALWQPEGPWMSFMLNTMGSPARALALADEGIARARSARSVFAEAFQMMVRSRFLYDAGNLEEARLQAESVADLAAELQLGDFSNATAGIVLFRIALHTGDAALADRLRPMITALSEGSGVTRAGRWTLVLDALDRDDLARAYELSALARQSIAQPIPPMTTPADFADDVILARVCADMGDAIGLDHVAAIAARRAQRNPGNDYVAGIALLVDAVRTGSSDAAARGIRKIEPSGRALVIADAHELAAALSEGDVAITHLESARHLYEDSGATRDADRVLRALRARGVHRRPAARSSDPSGLSPREQQVVQHLVAGATTQQIADALHLSTHTVNTHLRHVYAKLGVNSRREVIANLRR